MTLKDGDSAPGFAAPTTTGEMFDLKNALKSGPVVIFFYPKAFTPGCTAQSCRFRDLNAEFDELGATVVGVSGDDQESQERFGSKHGFGFDLLVDPESEISRLYGTKRIGVRFPRRVTFAIGQDGKIIDIIRSETNMNAHADGALAALKRHSEDPARG